MLTDVTSGKVSREVTQTHSRSYNVFQIALSCLEDKLASSFPSGLRIHGDEVSHCGLSAPRESNGAAVTGAVTAPPFMCLAVVERGYNHASVYTVGEVHDCH